MNEKDVQTFGNYILASLHMSGEYNKSKGLTKKVLLVEGKTDVAFINHIKSEDTSCKSIHELLQPHLVFLPKSNREGLNYKEIIKSILWRLAKDPTFFGFPTGSEKWPLYGMVDNDYENPIGLVQIMKLFYTGTHDIETLMLSTDEDLLSRVRLCAITREDAKKALYLSYQLAHFRQAMFKEGTFPQYTISEADGTVDFASFTEDNRIILSDLLAAARKHLPESISLQKLKRAQSGIIAVLKNKVDKNGLWKKALDTFSANQNDDFWQITNGHDILSAIRYVNPEAKAAFENVGGFSHNRYFELALSEVYDFHCFADTELYGKLLDAQLITAC